MVAAVWCRAKRVNWWQPWIAVSCQSRLRRQRATTTEMRLRLYVENTSSAISPDAGSCAAAPRRQRWSLPAVVNRLLLFTLPGRRWCRPQFCWHHHCVCSHFQRDVQSVSSTLRLSSTESQSKWTLYCIDLCFEKARCLDSRHHFVAVFVYKNCLAYITEFQRYFVFDYFCPKLAKYRQLPLPLSLFRLFNVAFTPSFILRMSHKRVNAAWRRLKLPFGSIRGLLVRFFRPVALKSETDRQKVFLQPLQPYIARTVSLVAPLQLRDLSVYIMTREKQHYRHATQFAEPWTLLLLYYIIRWTWRHTFSAYTGD